MRNFIWVFVGVLLVEVPSGWGKEDIAHNNCQVMLKKFDEMDIKYTYSGYPGGHAWPVWRHDLYSFASLLFK